MWWLLKTDKLYNNNRSYNSRLELWFSFYRYCCPHQHPHYRHRWRTYSQLVGHKLLSSLRCCAVYRVDCLIWWSSINVIYAVLTVRQSTTKWRTFLPVSFVQLNGRFGHTMWLWCELIFDFNRKRNYFKRRKSFAHRKNEMNLNITLNRPKTVWLFGKCFFFHYFMHSDVRWYNYVLVYRIPHATCIVRMESNNSS